MLLAFVNGRRHIRTFSVFQALRYLLAVLLLVTMVSLSVAGSKLFLIFSLSETVLFFLIFCYSTQFFKLRVDSDLIGWITKHFIFGVKAAGGNVLLDANTRVDVLILGIFGGDKTVGIYSFAAMVADGFNQLAVVIRTNVNPIITKYKYEKKKSLLQDAINKGKVLSYQMMVPAGIFTTLLFPLLLRTFDFGAEYESSRGILAVLMMGTLISVGYLPFKMVLNQVGLPGYQSLYITLIFLTNVLLNLALVPVLSAYGAAIATAVAFTMQAVYLRLLVRKKLHIRI